MTTPLHQYQRAVLFGFIASLAIFVLYISLAVGIISPQTEQIIGALWIIAYTFSCFLLRRKIPDNERIDGIKRPIVHWVLLGIALVYFNAVRPSDFQFLYPIINTGFILFAIFSADAHWDYKQIADNK